MTLESVVLMIVEVGKGYHKWPKFMARGVSASIDATISFRQ